MGKGCPPMMINTLDFWHLTSGGKFEELGNHFLVNSTFHDEKFAVWVVLVRTGGVGCFKHNSSMRLHVQEVPDCRVSGWVRHDGMSTRATVAKASHVNGAVSTIPETDSKFPQFPFGNFPLPPVWFQGLAKGILCCNVIRFENIPGQRSSNPKSIKPTIKFLNSTGNTYNFRSFMFVTIMAITVLWNR